MTLRIGSVFPGLIVCIVMIACGTTGRLLDEESTDTKTDPSDNTPNTGGDVDTDVDGDSDSDTDTNSAGASSIVTLNAFDVLPLQSGLGQ